MILRQTESFFAFFREDDVLEGMFRSFLGHQDLVYSKRCVYLQSLQKIGIHEKRPSIHLSVLCRGIPADDVGPPALVAHSPESSGPLLSAAAFLLPAGAQWQDR